MQIQEGIEFKMRLNRLLALLVHQVSQQIKGFVASIS